MLSFHLQGKDRLHYLSVSLLNCSGFLGCARSAQQNIGGSVVGARSVHLNYVESEKNVPGGCTRAIKTQGEPQGFWIPWRINCAEEAQRDRVPKNFVELCSGGH
jgi:hypothetical protein